MKQKGLYPSECIGSLKFFVDDKLPDRWEFFSSLKGECISVKYSLHPIDIWIMFKMNIKSDYHDL